MNDAEKWKCSTTRMKMKPIEYKAFCETTYACPPGTNREEYLQLLLIEELGKVARLFAKAMRDGAPYWVPCPRCDGGHTDPRNKCSQCRALGYVEEPRIYGPKAVNRDALKKELGDVIWCAAMLTDIEEIEDWFDWPQFLDPFGVDDWNRYMWSFQNTSILVTACSMCQHYGFTPQEVALANVGRLKGVRKQLGVL